MKHKLIILLSSIGLLALMEGNAQEKKIISLNEAIELSIKNSHQLKNNQAKIEEATAALKEATEKRLPNASVSGSYLRLNSANFDLKTKSNSGTGGTPAETPKVSQAMYGLLNISLPIYSGGRIKYGIESSRYLEQAAKLDAEDDRDEIIQNTIEAFANLFKAKTAVSLVKENLLQSQQRAKDFTNLEKNGLLARNDLLKAELQSSNTELSLVDAENNWQLANINMNLMLGLPDATEIVLDTAGIEKRDDARTLEDFVQSATNNRKDMAALSLRKKAAESGVKVSKSELYPSLQLTGGYIAADIPNVFTVTNAVNIGAGISYNIASWWKTKAKVQQADARVKQFAENQAMLNDNIRLQVNKSYLTLLSNRKKIEVYAKAVTQAQENYRIVKNKFDNNLATTTDLLEADVAQLQARLNYTLSRADAFVAYNKLLQTAGISITDFKNK
ncbi:MAG: TolC family protein [Chitinophagaceae bacterium]|nr:TolC family protein [Chitinophagaceae bacterium]